MQEVARVVLALEANEVAEEVMHFLDRSGTARVVGTAADDRQLIEAVRQLEPDAVVAHPSLVDPASVRGPARARARHQGVGGVVARRDPGGRAGLLPVAGRARCPRRRDRRDGHAAARER